MPSPRLDPYEENAKRTPEQRHANASKAGKASAEAKRRRKRMRETFEEWLKAGVTAEALLAVMEQAGVPREEQTYQTAITIASLNKAAGGDIEAARFVRDTVGEKPTDALRMSITDKPIKSLDLSALSDEELEALADSLDD